MSPPGIATTIQSDRRSRPNHLVLSWTVDDLVVGETRQVRDGGVRPPDTPGLGVGVGPQGLGEVCGLGVRGRDLDMRIGAYVGGTFTDVVLMESSGRIRTSKVLSTPPDFEAAVLAAIEQMMMPAGLPGTAVQEVAHGTRWQPMPCWSAGAQRRR